MYARRLVAKVVDSLADTPVVFLQGARQTGKSTLARSLVASGHFGAYFSLDSAAVLAAASADPEGFVAGLEGSVVIDEVQRAPALALAIKAAVDADRRPGRFLLTGSANVMALPRLGESLAGRVELHTLWPLTQDEIEGARGASFVDRLFDERTGPLDVNPSGTGDLWERVLRGGYPEALKRRADRRAAWFDSYIATILQRDVRDLSRIEHLAEVPRLLALLASRTGSLLNYAELSRSLAFPQSTLKRYMALLQGTFLVWLLPAWSVNLGKRLIKSPKLMLVDSGLLCHLVGLSEGSLSGERTQVGHVLETFAIMEITRQLGWSRTRCDLFHLRADTGQEVDLVLEDRRGRLAAVEVKAASSVGERDLSGLRFLAGLAPDRFTRGVLLYTGSAVVPFSRNLHAMPISALWSGS